MSCAMKCGCARSIAAAAGCALVKECKEIIQRDGELRLSQVVVTKAGKLSDIGILYVIHACGPRNDSCKKDQSVIAELLTNTFYNVLVCANDELKVASVAIPAISSGIYGVEKNLVANMAFDALVRFDNELLRRQNHPTRLLGDQNLRKIRFVNIDTPTTQVFVKVFASRKNEDKAHGGFEWVKHSEKVNRQRKTSGGGSGKNQGSHSKSSERRNVSTGEVCGPCFSENDSQSLPLMSEHGCGTEQYEPSGNEQPNSWPTKSKPHSRQETQIRSQDIIASVHGDPKKNTVGGGLQGNAMGLNIGFGSPAIVGPLNYGSPQQKELTGRGGLGQVNGHQVRNHETSTEAGIFSSDIRTGSEAAQIDYDSEPRVRHKPMMTDEPSAWNFPSHPPNTTEPKLNTGPAKPCTVGSRTTGTPKEIGLLATSTPVLGDCAICQDTLMLPKTLACGHRFCAACIDQCFKLHQPKCPTCGRMYGAMKGNQPEGTIMVTLDKTLRLAGYEHYNTIVIDYNFSGGIQGPEHPNPGQRYTGTTRKAYLPCSPEGQEVSALLQRAFEQRLIFTIGRSNTTGVENAIIWNDIHHKTSLRGQYGYPDDTYLVRVKGELAAKGIVQKNESIRIKQPKLGQTSVF